jgi:hypothetical protein
MSRSFVTTAFMVASTMLLPAFAKPENQAQAPQDHERVDKLEKRIAELELHVAMLEACIKSQNPKFGPAMEKGLNAAKSHHLCKQS